MASFSHSVVNLGKKISKALQLILTTISLVPFPDSGILLSKIHNSLVEDSSKTAPDLWVIIVTVWKVLTPSHFDPLDLL